VLRLASLTCLVVLLASIASAQKTPAAPTPAPAPTAPEAASAAACTPPADGAAKPPGTAPTLDAISPGYFVTGQASKSAQIVIICVDGKQADTVETVTAAPNKAFYAQLKNELTADKTTTVTAQEKTPGASGSADTYGPLSDAVTVGTSAASFDFGRVRVYLSAGAILSQDQGQFSKTSTYLDFGVDNAWYLRNHSESEAPKGGFQVNTLFDARLTALPTATCTAASSTSGASTTSTNCDTSTTITPSVSTPKAALVEGGLYTPIYFKWTSWKFEDGHRYALYVAPLVKGGFQTLVQSAQSSTGTAGGSTSSVTTIGGNTFFHFFEVGSRFGLYKFHDEAHDVAPDQLLYLDIAGGRYQSFPSVNTTAGSATAGAITGYPWRLSMEGRFMVPKIPVFLGFNSNTLPGSHRITNAPGDLRFLFGTSFDVGCLLQKVGVSSPGVAACDSTKSSSTSAPAAKK
jgi:hypothetical protein